MNDDTNKRNNALVLVTTGYPTGLETESSFIRPEIGVLAKHFDKVIVAPRIDYGRSDEPLPDGVSVDRQFAGMPTAKDKLRALISPELWRDLIADLPQIRSLTSLRRSMAISTGKLLFRRKLKQLLRRHSLDPKQTTVYTFWFDFATEAAATIPGLHSVVSRAHRYDLYEEEEFISRAARRRTLKKMRGVYVCSLSGEEYLKTKYPEYADRIHTSYLGTLEHTPLPKSAEPEPPTLHKPDVTLFCCARLEEVKRVPQQLQAVSAWARRHPELNVRWIHAGDGGERTKLEETARALPDNVTVSLLGGIGNEDVHSLLGSGEVDALLLTSSSEGLPVVLMEAMSHGVPVLATDVGGVREIVDETTGELLPSEFSQEEFSAALDHLLETKKEKSAAARRKWEKGFDAVRLREEFVKTIRK